MVAALALIALHVQGIAVTSDTLRPKLDVPFHVTISIRLKENVSDLQDVYLPTFYGPEELGDERTYTHGRNGTLYRETMTLEAHTRGPLHISPAYLDAIDARDGKPKRFLSNDLNLIVEGGPAFDVWAPVRAAGAAISYALLALAAAFVIFALFARRRSVPPPIVEQAPAQTESSQAPAADALEAAFAQLRDRRDRRSALALRSLLWRRAGACEGETLADVLRKPAARDAGVRALLVDVERAAFVEDAHLSAAIDVLLSRRTESVFA